jgi:hypothetical protein
VVEDIGKGFRVSARGLLDAFDIELFRLSHKDTIA